MAQAVNPFDVQGNHYTAASSSFSDHDTDKFRVVEVIETKTPFANLPFLEMRENEKLVRAQTFHVPSGYKGNRKDKPPAAGWSEPSYWITRGAKVSHLDVGSETWVERINAASIRAEKAGGEDGKLNLTSANDTAYFSWKATRENADALFRFCRNVSYPPSLNLKQLAQMETLLLPDYPEYLSHGLTDFSANNRAFSPGFQAQSEQSGKTLFVYAGLEFEARTGVYQYRWSVDNYGWNEERTTLIAAPEALNSAFPMMQMALPFNWRETLPKETRRRLDAQDARYKKWRAIIDSVLATKP